MVPDEIYADRLSRLRKALAIANLDGAVIVPGPNMRYLTGVNSLLLERPFLLLVPTDGMAHLVAPALEAGPYRNCPLPMSVHDWTDSQGSTGAIRKAVKETPLGGTWGV